MATCSNITLIFISAALIISQLGLVIFGGVWWSRLNPGCRFLTGRAWNLWQTTLAMWILGIVSPLVGPLICGFVMVGWTDEKGCADLETSIVAQLGEYGTAPAQLIDWYNKYFTDGKMASSLCQDGFVTTAVFCGLAVISLPIAILRAVLKKRAEQGNMFTQF